MLAVWKKELQTYFLSPIAYVFMGAFIAVTGLFFTLINVMSASASFTQTLSSLTFLFTLVVPILTMRLLSEERLNKTDQLLLTSPISLTSIVMGKFLAAMTVFFVTLVLSLVYPLVLAIFGNPAFGEIFTGYVGFFLLGGALISIGIFMSALTENQVTSAVATFGVLLVLQMIDGVSSVVDVAWITTVIQWISLFTRFAYFSMGLLSLTPIIYYLSVTALMLLFTIRTIDRRRWSEG
jgi:ABC-2 type transport system permease protein